MLPGGSGNETDDETADVRVAAVLAVLAGRSTTEVAKRNAVNPALLHRWVRAFIEAGTARVLNRPDVDAARQRDRFLAAFAHEVRAPMLVASGWAAMVREGVIPPERRDPALDRICEALDTLAERTLDVELMAAAAMGRLAIRPERVTVEDLTSGLPDLMDIDGEGGGVTLSVDPEYFPRVLRDLWRAGSLDPAPRSLRLEVATHPPWVEVRVVRDGDPVDPQRLQALFDPFDLNADHTGVSIGLYLARALAVAHGGTIGIEQDEHCGVLWVRVPRRLPGAR
ncbi:MAG: ATP-binding protein [Propionibacteriaceae bacterium]